MTASGAPFSLRTALAVLLLLVLAATPGLAQTWIELTPALPDGQPPDPIWGVKPAHYDPATNRLIVFFPGKIGYGGFGNQVWVLTNANGLGGTPSWLKLNPSGAAPNVNGGESVVYDVLTNRLIVYGGCYSNCSPALGYVFALSNANGLGGTPAWSDIPASPYWPRVDHSAVLDAANNLMMTFGGHYAFFGTDQNDSRVLSGANGLGGPPSWTTLMPTGSRPGVRCQHSAVYDEATNRMTIFAGTNLVHACCPYDQNDYNDVWVLSGANGLAGTAVWTRLFPAGNQPALRSGHSAVYDPVHNRMLIFGGGTWSDQAQNSTMLGDLWELSYANGIGGTPEWTQLYPTGSGPGPRTFTSAAFDALNQRMILLDGRNDTEEPRTSNRVWVLMFNQAPAADAGADQRIECAGCAGTPVTLDGSRSSDPDGDALEYTWTGPFGSATGATPTVTLPLGQHEITLTVSDGSGGATTDTVLVTIVHEAGPVIGDVSVSAAVLWPPNHLMVPLSVRAAAADACDDAPVVRIVSVTSNEPTNGLGDGDTAPDWEITGDLTLNLRAERSGSGSGRTYTITMQATDNAGNVSPTRIVTVFVPKDQKKK